MAEKRTCWVCYFDCHHHATEQEAVDCEEQERRQRQAEQTRRQQLRVDLTNRARTSYPVVTLIRQGHVEEARTLCAREVNNEPNLPSCSNWFEATANAMITAATRTAQEEGE